MKKEDAILCAAVAGTILGLIIGFAGRGFVAELRSTRIDPMQAEEDDYRRRSAVWDSVRNKRIAELQAARQKTMDDHGKLITELAEINSNELINDSELGQQNRNFYLKILEDTEIQTGRLDAMIREYKRPLKHPRA